MTVCQCHIPDCPTPSPPGEPLCAAHWAALPQPTRDALRREHEAKATAAYWPTGRWMAVLRMAIGEVLFKSEREEDREMAGQCVLAADGWRHAAVRGGEGDPFAGMGAS